MKLILIALLILLPACAAQPPQVIEHTVVQTVDVPVLTKETAPDELMTCGSNLPAPAVVDAPGGLQIPDNQVDALTGLIGNLAKCITAWRVWASP